MRLLICAGGTGGGVYPALSVLQALTETRSCEVLWVGGEGGMETDLVQRENIPFDTIPAAGVHGIGLRSMPGNLLQLLRGYFKSLRILRRYRPDALFFTGGFVGVPMALAGWHTPSVVYVPDIEPALALKVLARLARRIAVTTSDSLAYFTRSTKVTVTGYPVRRELRRWERPAARQALGLDPDLLTLLVFGGSKGAQSINQAVMSILPDVLSEMQIVHISGRLDWPNIQSAYQDLPGRLSDPALANRYHPYAYLHDEMGAALSAADLVLSRAGASALGEFPWIGLPAILVPYPYAWRYQQVNANWLARHGAACVVNDAQLSTQLLPVLRDLAHNPGKLTAMRNAMAALARPSAAESIANLILQLVGEGDRKGI